ncbi:hypothetical protein FYZ48_07060 [Gimesia chilikensis]|uniref:hypothetical protein n=1 Tax=Gimesia chilikensis TaxID=2605989 RepID=UPI0011F03698|nr:hypothetical protein [Gimesia chilikensis]KAA0141025.1 hypothetical protein FYZ48_07060 [Gimesia chilikensis]
MLRHRPQLSLDMFFVIAHYPTAFAFKWALSKKSLFFILAIKDYHMTDFLKLSSYVLDDPFLLLALSLSAPAEQSSDLVNQSFNIDLATDGIHLKFPYPKVPLDKTGQLYSSKETIALSFVLLEMWLRGGKEAESKIERVLRDFAVEVATSANFPEQGILKPDIEGQKKGCTQYLLKELGAADILLYSMDDRLIHTFRALENNGLVIDPGITGAAGIMVLLGLVPVRWCVRTPKGQRVLREVRIRAGLWSLDMQQVRKGKKISTDWDLNIRGVDFTKKVLTMFCKEYLATEVRERDRLGLPNIEQPSRINIDHSSNDG